MILYKCLLTGDDLFTDAKPPGFIKRDKGFIIVKGKHTTRSNAIDESAFGFNASAEEASEGTDDGATSGIDVEIDSGLMKTGGFADKTTLQVAIKQYIKELMPTIPEDQKAAWKEKMMTANKFAIEKRKEMDESYSTASLHENGMPIFMIWEVKEGDGEQDHPYFYFFEGGVKEEKC